jgi:hypothetical protein
MRPLATVARALSLMVLALGTATPCAAQQEGTPDLARILEDRVNAESLLPWHPSRPLIWSDFQGPPDAKHQMQAMAFTGATYQSWCSPDTLTVEVVATFSPRLSWAKSELVKNRNWSTRILQHEQVHFDIAEVFARQLRQAFAGADSLCLNSGAGLQVVYDSLWRTTEEMQDQYDEDTNHGRDPKLQADWTSAVAALLNGLSAFRGVIVPTR